MFGKKNSKKPVLIGVYSLFDLEIPDTKFSPPFFSISDDLAEQAVLETMRRHSTSYEALYSSAFRRMRLWRVGSFDVFLGKLVSDRKNRYLVTGIGDLLDRDYVKHYMKTVPYPTKEEVEK